MATSLPLSQLAAYTFSYVRIDHLPSGGLLPVDVEIIEKFTHLPSRSHTIESIGYPATGQCAIRVSPATTGRFFMGRT